MSKATVDIKGVGTTKAGYAKPELGPFKCSHCVWFGPEESTCAHPDVKEDPEVEHTSKGLGKVSPDGCCNYYRPHRKMVDIPFNTLGL
jgi:hypothetical protein